MKCIAHKKEENFQRRKQFMKKKTISMVIVAIMSAMTATSLSGCGTQTSATNVQISEGNRNETVVIDEEEIVVNNESESDTENADLKGNEDIVFYDDLQGVSEEVDLSNLIVMEPAVEIHFIADTDFYDIDGHLAGYVKADAYVAFNTCNEKWASFEFEGADLLIPIDVLQNNAVNENLVEATPDVSTMAEDVTDGNIVLYGGEKYPQKYSPLDEGTPEEVSIELTNVEADIPLYSVDGRLCGHLNKGGSIEITEHCTVATAWYRFPNPIEGTEHEYLYVLRYETIMSGDEKESIEKILREADHLERTELLDAPDADMECYEFSIAREKYFDVGNMLYEYGLLEYDRSLNRLVHNTFYVECNRNGDYFDCKVYYK